SVAEVRPYAVRGIVRVLDLEDALLRSLVDLQEKLHLTVGRRRKKVAIGIHDMDKVTPPYTYKAVLPTDVRFTPLGMAQEMDLLEILTKHEKGREYAHLVAAQPVFPIIMDARGQVLSFPPVINGILTQLTPDTRNLFIDVTGTDLEAGSGCLAILSTSSAERGGRSRTVRTTCPGPASPAAPPDDRRVARGERCRGDPSRPPRGLRIPGGDVADDRVLKGRLRDARSRPDQEPAERRSHDPPLVDASGAHEHLPLEQAP